MAKQELRYSDAIKELEEILKEIEEKDPEIDDILDKIKRATFLISFCKQKLKSTENEVENILKQIE